MKKALLIAAVALGAVAFSSCKKTYSCNCTHYITGNIEVRTEKGVDAQAACNDAENAVLGISEWDCLPQ
tara:strand:+ start:263 stop:469 length:207 start_codon:yes stop_codon:yes gene_type:complete